MPAGGRRIAISVAVAISPLAFSAAVIAAPEVMGHVMMAIFLVGMCCVVGVTVYRALGDD